MSPLEVALVIFGTLIIVGKVVGIIVLAGRDEE